MRGKVINFLLIVIIFALGAGAMYFVKDKFLDKKTSETIITEKRDVTITDESGISEAVDKVYDAVVMIKIYSGSKYIGSGSGFVYKTDDDYDIKADASKNMCDACLNLIDDLSKDGIIDKEKDKDKGKEKEIKKRLNKLWNLVNHAVKNDDNKQNGFYS